MGKSKKNKSKGGVPSEGKKKVADEGGMDVDEVLEETVAAAETGEVAATEDMPDQQPLSSKDRKRAEMEAKRTLKVKVSQLKQTSKKLKKKDYVQKADRRVMDRHIRELVKETKDQDRQKDEARQEHLNALPGKKIQ
jgi:hypothetical protein